MITTGLLLSRAISTSILTIIDTIFFLGGYSILRLVRISVNWITWIIGALLILLSIVTCIFCFTVYHNFFDRNGLLGGFAFLIAVYSAGQWTTRHWYVFLKKNTTRFLVQPSRNLLLFLRKHHQFFGWLVVITATAHAVSYLPLLTRVPMYELISGLVAWAILAVLIGIGMWIEYAVKRKLVTKNARLFHFVTTIAFFIAFIAHV